MRSRHALAICLIFVSAGLLIPGNSQAAKIDPELAAAMASKSDHAQFPVLMIYDDPHNADDLLMELDRLSPKKRRKKVLEILKKKGRKTQTNAMVILRNIGHQPNISQVKQLYLANAISFEATAGVVQALATLSDSATLYLDKNYDLTAGTSRGVVAPTNKAARADTAWSVNYINAGRVWSDLGYTGSGIVVGHIDSGIDLDHPDLVNQLWINAGEIPGNGIDDDLNGFIDDVNGWDFGDNDSNPNDDGASPGHGTHTAGTVAGDGSNGTLTGVAPGAKLMACKAFDSSGSGSLGMIWAAEQYCVENGARVITMSLGIKGELPAVYMRNERVNCANIRDAGVTLFNSAGNEHYQYSPPIECGMTARVPAPWNALTTTPGNLGGVIAVGGTGYNNDLLYSSSSRGPAKWDDVDPYNDWPYNPGDGLLKPDVSAPGTNVNSTTVGGGYSGNTWSGTSMACPHVAGLAALMLEKNPSLSPAGIDSVMELNSVDLGAAGKDNSFGSGRIDALAIVSATPTSISADLVQMGLLPDHAGDGVLDSGAVNTMAFELKNVSKVTDALGVIATLAVIPNAYVTVSDDEAVFPDIAMNGGTGSNTADTFSLDVAAGAPQGFEFTMLLSVSSGTYFERTFEIDWYVGLPHWRTHNIGDVYLTVTDQGILGYMDNTGAVGDGMGYLDGGSGLFVGSFWAGTGVTYVCNRDFSGGGDTREWEVSVSPNGGVADLGATVGDQTFKSIFTDSGHASPKPLQVEQTSYAFSGAGNNEFVILNYQLTNDGASALPNLSTGVFCDFDINDSSANLGGTDSARNLTYMYSDGGSYFGIALLGAENSATNLTLLNNPQYVYPNGSVDDGMKMRHMLGTISLPTSTGPDDWSALTSRTVSLDASGGTAEVTYALVYGATLADLNNNVDAANAANDPLSPVSEKAPVKLFRLAQNHPNPFNPSTSIMYSVVKDGPVDLAIYDLSGRRVRTLVNETRASGEYSVMWDGNDAAGNAVPSGMYFYKFESGGQSLSRKMTLVK
jgi:subtilisin family serine protease